MIIIDFVIKGNIIVATKNNRIDSFCIISIASYNPGIFRNIMTFVTLTSRRINTSSCFCCHRRRHKRHRCQGCHHQGRQGSSGCGASVLAFAVAFCQLRCHHIHVLCFTVDNLENPVHFLRFLLPIFVLSDSLDTSRTCRWLRSSWLLQCL